MHSGVSLMCSAERYLLSFAISTSVKIAPGFPWLTASIPRRKSSMFSADNPARSTQSRAKSFCGGEVEITKFESVTAVGKELVQRTHVLHVR